MYHFFASAPKGVESVLAEELRSFGAADIASASGGVSFSGTLETGCMACLWSRTASKILLTVSEFDASSESALYEGVRSFDWNRIIPPTGTIAVDFTTRAAPQFANSHFGALRVKDAIVDRFRDETGVRPSVDLDRPDLRVCVHVSGSKASMSLDLAGESLHRRGYRKQSTLAPLKENLAASILLMADWPRVLKNGGALLDPMCGSGTFLAEAALMACDTAPGLLHAPFSFTRWKDFDLSTWNKMLAEARERDLRRSDSVRKLPIFGFDVDPSAVSAARTNANRAGLGNAVRIDVRELSFSERPEGFSSGILVANPPYGERLGEVRSLARLYRRLGDVLKQRFAGWRGFILAGNQELSKEVGLRAVRKIPLRNGAIECRLLEIPVGTGCFDPKAHRPESAFSAAESAVGVQGAAGSAADESRNPNFGAHSQDKKALPSETSDRGEPKARRISDAAVGFANRLEKNFKRLSKWASKEDIHCYRVYDADLPDYALAIDLYERWVHVQEYAPPSSVEPAKAERRLQEALSVIPEVLGVLPSDIHLKVRRRQKGLSQYEKFGGEGTFYEVREGGLKFLVNLSDYLDTGLFLDHRPMRRLIGERSKDRRFLNLFGYTGTATVYAAAGGAASSVTVDLSNTYLDWGRRNLAVNGLDNGRHEFIRADVMRWLPSARGRFDLIFVDPPTFSKSSSMEGTFDVQRDHRQILEMALKLLSPDGELYFSTNLRSFRLEADAFAGYSLKEISRQTIAPDFRRNERIHQAWCFTRSERIVSGR